MARYIDADNFRKIMIKRFGCIPCLTDYSEASRYDIPIDDALNLAPAAEVAPKSEVEWLEKENARLLSLSEYNRSVIEQDITDAKAEVAREIFEEIENKINDDLKNNKRVLPQVEISNALWNRVSGKINALQGVLEYIAELKKKYTGDAP